MFDFDNVPSRRGTNSAKWNVGENELPMWVADMDFPVAPAITEALERRIKHPIFGYAEVPDEWYDAYIGWWRDRHGLEPERDRLMFCTGVVPAISSIVRKLTTPAEKVLIQTPVYNIFFNSILNNGRVPLESPLAYDGSVFSMDFDRLERDLSDPQVSLMILCNPHNPVGRIWDRETLARVGELCKKHSVTVISDEIHCDLTAPDELYVPFASVSDTCRDISVTCIAPTKTFNIAGLQTSAVYVPNGTLFHRVRRGLNTDEVAEPNVFAVEAAIAAFNHGGEWLDALRIYIEENKRIVSDFLANELPAVRAVISNATYLVWLDCTDIGIDSGEIADFVRADSGLFLSRGGIYGGIGDRFLRMNLACPHSTVVDGLGRLKKSVEKLIALK